MEEDRQGQLERGGGGASSPGPSGKRTPPMALSSIGRLASSLSLPSAAAEALGREMEEAEAMADEELVRELATPRVAFPPLKTARESNSVAAPYGPDEPMSLQNTLRGTFNISYVPPIGQSMIKVMSNRPAHVRTKGSSPRLALTCPGHNTITDGPGLEGSTPPALLAVHQHAAHLHLGRKWLMAGAVMDWS